MAAAIGRALGTAFNAAKGINFIFRAQATILWWVLEQKPARPDGAQLSTENLRRNNRFLWDYLRVMRYDDIREIGVDLAGLGAGGAVRGVPLRFPAALAATIFSRKWAATLLGFTGEKSFLGLFPSPDIPGFPIGQAFDAGLSIAGGAMALVNQGINIGAGLTSAISSGDVLGGIQALRKIPSFIRNSIDFVANAGTTVSEIADGFAEVGLAFAQDVEVIARDMAATVQYYALLVGRIVGFASAPTPRVFEKFVFRTPDQILIELMGPVTDVGSRFVAGDVRPPTIGEQRTFGAREAVRQARERASSAQAIPSRLTIENAKKIARVGIEFQQEQLQMSLGVLGRSRGMTDTGLLELLQEIKKGR